MSQKKLTPALTPGEVFEHLKALFPWIKRIEKSSMYKDGLFFRNPQGNGLHFHEININWGGAISYEPERWRPATVEDAKRALDEPIECRTQEGKTGKIVGGYLSSAGILIFNVRMASVTCVFNNVEVRE